MLGPTLHGLRGSRVADRTTALKRLNEWSSDSGNVALLLGAGAGSSRVRAQPRLPAWAPSQTPCSAPIPVPVSCTPALLAHRC